MNKPTTVVMADDHTLVRETLANWLRSTGDIQVLADVGSADEAVAEAIRHRPDVVLLDIDMPGLHSFDAARTIKDRCPRTRLIFVSAFVHDHYIESALKVESSGYITKAEAPEVVVQAIRAVAAGGAYFSPEVQARLVIGAHGVTLTEGRGATRVSTLTPRELEVLRYIASGLSKKDIAGLMHLSVKTVDNHSTSLMAKLDIHDRVELARFAIREGVAKP